MCLISMVVLIIGMIIMIKSMVNCSMIMAIMAVINIVKVGLGMTSDKKIVGRVAIVGDEDATCVITGQLNLGCVNLA